MRLWNCALWAILGCAAHASSALSQQLSEDTIKMFRTTAREICESVKDARGTKTNAQLQGDVQAKVGGLAGKVFGNLGGVVTGQVSQEEFEGLSREATAIAVQGDRDCRERVFAKLLDKLSAPAQPQPQPPKDSYRFTVVNNTNMPITRIEFKNPQNPNSSWGAPGSVGQIDAGRSYGWDMRVGYCFLAVRVTLANGQARQYLVNDACNKPVLALE